ncbi:MAG TPA: DUF1835 domain-containing protein [Ktedonobacteraceae bacterium]|nr:DUF1835 domain-containing protein [Ktedonobacteraceae bacterium]
MAHTSKRIIAISERFYRRLLVVYPATFRRQYGSQMMQVFLDCCRAAYQKRGSWGVLRLWIFMLGDLLTNAIAEQLSMLIQRLRTRKAIFDTQLWPMLSGRGGNMLHITNGDSVGGTLRQTGLPGDILTWKDILHEGPTPTGLSLEQMTAIRAQFLAANAMGTYEDILADFVQRDTTLAQFAAHNEVILWFEHDLYDQLQLIQILDWFSHHNLGKTAVSLICIDAFPGIARFTGLGQLNADQLRSLYETRHRLTEVEFKLGSEAWNAYCSPDPRMLEAFLRKDTSALPFLKAALLRHLEQFPALQGGLSRTERQILEVIASGAHKPLEIFRATQEKEESPFMGDSSLWLYLSTLTTGPKPFLKHTDGGTFAFPATDPTIGHYDTAFIEQELVLTDAGVNALAGQIDWIRINQGIDRWLGGVHLLGQDAAWRWDRQRAVLVQVGGTV